MNASASRDAKKLCGARSSVVGADARDLVELLETLGHFERGCARIVEVNGIGERRVLERMIASPTFYRSCPCDR
jgi:hypothetical protein